MRFNNLFKVAASVLLASSVLAETNDVVNLTKDDFQDTVENSPLALVKFFAPWCGHCKALAPEYKKAATALRDENIILAEVDCTVESDICNEAGVRGYPTLKVFREGKSSDYKGQRTADSIISYMKKQNLPDLTTVTAENFETFSNSDKVVIVGFVQEDSDEYKALLANAKEMRDDFVFGFSTDAEIAKKAGASVPGLVMFKQFDEGKVTMTESLTQENIKKFVTVESVPLMDELGPENYSKYMESGLPLVYLFTSDAEDKKTVGVWLEEIAKANQGKINFVYIDAVKFSGHGKFLGLKEKWPAVIIQDVKHNTKYPFPQDQELEKEAVNKFIESFKDGTLEPFVKSQDVPATQDKPVYTLVAKNFDEVALNKEKDVLVKFYAPWCGHCKKLAPVYVEVAEKLAASENLVIAEFDATENDIPPTSTWNNLEGFPTLVLFKGDDKNTAVVYEGDRSKDSIIEFLKKNAAKEVKEVIEATKAEEKEEEKEEKKEVKDEL